MGILFYVYLGFFLVVLFGLLVIWMVYSIKKDITLKKEGIKTQAKVLGYFKQKIRVRNGFSYYNYYYRMILEFTDEQGIKHIILNKLGQEIVKYKVGSIINISYKESNSHNFIEKINKKYEEYYDRNTVTDEKGIEYTFTDDTNKFDIAFLEDSGVEKKFLRIILIGYIIITILVIVIW